MKEPRLKKDYMSLISTYESQNYLSAISIADRILKYKENHAETLSVKGLCFMRAYEGDLEKLNEAQKLIKTAVIKNPSSSTTWQAMALYHKEIGESEKAINAFKLAFSRDQNHAPLARDIISLSAQCRKFDICCEYLLMLIKSAAGIGQWSNYIAYAIYAFFENNISVSNATLENLPPKIMDQTTTYIQWSFIELQCLFLYYSNEPKRALELLKMSEKSFLNKTPKTPRNIEFSQKLKLLCNLALLNNNNVTSQTYGSDILRLIDDLLEQSPDDFDYMLFHFYTHDDIEIRSIFGDPLRFYVNHDNNINRPRGPYVVKDEASAWSRLRTTRDNMNESLIEAFRTDFDLTYGMLSETVMNVPLPEKYRDKWEDIEFIKEYSYIGERRILNRDHIWYRIKNVGTVNRFLSATTETQTALMEFIQNLIQKYPQNTLLEYFNVIFESDDDSFQSKAQSLLEKYSFTKGVDSAVKDLLFWSPNRRITYINRAFCSGLEKIQEEKKVSKDVSSDIQHINALICGAKLFLEQNLLDECEHLLDSAMKLTNGYCKRVILTLADLNTARGKYSTARIVSIEASQLDLSCKFTAMKAMEACLMDSKVEEALNCNIAFTKHNFGDEYLSVSNKTFLDQLVKSKYNEDEVEIGSLIDACERSKSVWDTSKKDEYDFHQYAIRQGNFRSYVQFVNYMDLMLESHYYVNALTGLIQSKYILAKDPNKYEITKEQMENYSPRLPKINPIHLHKYINKDDLIPGSKVDLYIRNGKTHMTDKLTGEYFSTEKLLDDVKNSLKAMRHQNARDPKTWKLNIEYLLQEEQSKSDNLPIISQYLHNLEVCETGRCPLM